MLLDIENRGVSDVVIDDSLRDPIDKELEKTCLPIAIVNTLARLGCNYPDKQRLSMEELVKQFNPSKLSQSPARYDNQQLRMWQAFAMHDVFREIMDSGKSSTPASKYANEIKQYVDAKIKKHNELFDDDERVDMDTIQFIRTIRYNALSLDHIDGWHSSIVRPEETTLNLQICGADKQFYLQVEEVIRNSPDGSIDQLRDAWKDLVKAIQQATGKKGKELFLPLRMLLTGVDNGPPLDELYALIGKKELLKRLDVCLNLSWMRS